MVETLRQRAEEHEARTLAPQATLSMRTRGRRKDESACAIRTAFQRDRDRILHSKAFRRLKHKTQVFLSPEGDHYRTRLTHTLEVAQIARTVSRALRLNEDLTEAIALGHDLGHTPFGHAGEAILDELAPGGFRHFRQSLRVVDTLEQEGRGLNLCWEVRDGILKHSKGAGAVFTSRDKGRPSTLEGQVVRVSDVMAYVNHDLDDALRSGLIRASDIPKELTTALGKSHSLRIDALVRDVIRSSLDADLQIICMSPPTLQAMMDMRRFLYRTVYARSIPKDELLKAKKLLSDIYHHLLAHPDGIPQSFRRPEVGAERAAVDFVAGMTDRFALNLYDSLFLPRGWSARTAH